MTRNGNLFVPLAGHGRNINHDPKSRAYRASRAGEVALPKTVMWEPRIQPLDQGSLGRCVPTAGTAMLACDPFWDTLDKGLQRQLSVPVTAELFAVQAYRDVTALDPFLGTWEPDDTGSDGLSLWKLYRARGYVGGSEHVMNIDDAHVAIQKGPYPIGISLLADMERPNAVGVVSVSGANRGGHEVLLYGYDAARDLWWCRNSWGRDWGFYGDFAFDTPGYQKLMRMQADGVVMTPTNLPTPQPIAPTDPLDTFPYEEMDSWLMKVSRKIYRSKYEHAAATAYAGWRV